ncbi:MAG: carbamoyltransferase HypF [Candidatus Omnitrophica bacterium]|nr:carbamoyltransferase HypF [Candidatus Omnitrophota bacterium]
METKKISLPFICKEPILAVGPQSKNTLCFIKGKHAYFSPLHSDLNDPGDFSYFKSDLGFFLKKKPKIIACDLHQGYQSTLQAMEHLASTHKIITVQHHHSHIAACMAEAGMKNQKVIGIAFDGTGLGDDQALWGGEFLICDYGNYIRAAHLKEIPLLGGSQAIKEPWRLAVAWLYQIYKDRFLELNNDFLRGVNKKDWRILKKMYSLGFNAPLSSSMGRLFDAIASLILKKYKAVSEGSLAVELERKALCYKGKVKGFVFSICKTKRGYIIDPVPVFKDIVKGLSDKEEPQRLALRFHLGVAQAIKSLALLLRKETLINKVVLSGGVFQNRLLLKESKELLYKEGFTVLLHNKLSCNDSSISLGQASIASFRR